MKGCTEPCQNDLLALAVFWDYNDHGQNQNSRTLCTGDRCKKYSRVHIEMFFSSMPNTIIGVYPKLLFPQVSILIPGTIMAHGNQFKKVKLSSKLDSSDK